MSLASATVGRPLIITIELQEVGRNVHGLLPSVRAANDHRLLVGDLIERDLPRQVAPVDQDGVRSDDDLVHVRPFIAPSPHL